MVGQLLTANDEGAAAVRKHCGHQLAIGSRAAVVPEGDVSVNNSVAIIGQEASCVISSQPMITIIANSTYTK